MSSSTFSTSTTCFCGSKKAYAQCCQPLHNGALAVNAEALMRSRYCAYVLGLSAYIKSSWHTSTYSGDDVDVVNQQWLGLQLKRHEQLDDDHALVEFVARYKVNGRAFRLHEVSRFVREKGQWFYVDGDFLH